ncbi:MAG: hypothetical protein V1904_10155 [Bacteroidota bacterium]
MDILNKKIFFSFFIFISLTIKIQADTISVKQAMEMKLVKVELYKSSLSQNADNYSSSFTGDCIKMSIENLTDNDVKVLLEAGRFMEPDDTTEQRMIVTRQQMISLYKKQKKEVPVYAMCSEMEDAAPDSLSIFEMGPKAEGDLLTLAQLISKNNWQDMAAQSAIWALTDGNDYGDIYSDNKSEMASLREIVKKAKGITTPSFPQGDSLFSINTESEGTYLKYLKGEVSGSFEFTLKNNLNLTMTLYNDEGEVVIKGFSNHTFKKGIHQLTYTYTYYSFPIGNYYLKLFDDKGNVFLEKMLTFK